MITHCITLPNGTKIEMFFSDVHTQQEIEDALKDVEFPIFEQFQQQERAKLKAERKAMKKAHKKQQRARRKYR